MVSTYLADIFALHMVTLRVTQSKMYVKGERSQDKEAKELKKAYKEELEWKKKEV